MKVLLEKSGTASLTLMGGEVIAGYATLVVREQAGVRDGSGQFRTESPEIHKAMIATEDPTLQFADGVSARVMATMMDAIGIRFFTTGPVTGI